MLSELSLDFEKIKKSYDTIINTIQNKNEEEIFSDLNTSSENNEISFKSSLLMNSSEAPKLLLENKKGNIYYFHPGVMLDRKFLSEACEIAFSSDKNDFTEYKVLSDLLHLTSNEFLQNKIGLNETQIQKIKGNRDSNKNNGDDENIDNDNRDNIVEKEVENSNQINSTSTNNQAINTNKNIVTAQGELENILNKTKGKQKINASRSNKSEPNNSNDKDFVSKEKEKLEKEIEEENFKEMIHNARLIKNYANTFKKTFEKDSKVNNINLNK